MGLTSAIVNQTIFRTSSLSPSEFDKAISQCPLLEGLSLIERKQILKSAPKRLYSLGEQICERGNYGHSFFILVSGAVELGYFQELPQQERSIWHSHDSLTDLGTSFGEESLLAGAKRTYSAVATLDSTAVIEVDLPLFTRLDALVGGKLSKLINEIQRENLVINLLNSNLILKDLTAPSMNLLAKSSELFRLNRGDILPHDSRNLVVMIEGLISVEEARGQETKSLLYLNKGDIFTGGAAQQSIQILAKEATSLVTINEMAIKRIPVEDQRLLQKLAITLPVSSQSQAMPNTVFQFVKQMVDEGAQQGLSLLSIDLDQCVRCGQCVRSCESRHGHSKMTRRGRTVQRRRDIKVEGDYQAILLPSSCRHCSSPECMVGCPTSAIHRGVDGEVDIKETCIGCGSCANRCPYGNITMVPTPEREVAGVNYDLKASKCNLCSGYDQPNCVNNCPTGAMLRVEPQQYFEEFSHLIGDGISANTVAGADKTSAESSTSQKSKNKTVHIILSVITVILAGLGGAMHFMAPTSVWSSERMILGICTAGLMVAAGLLAARRRWAGRKKQFGRLYVWTQAHLYLGGLSLLFMVYHTGGSMGQGLTLGLWTLTWMEVAIGLFGLVLYRKMPQILTYLEGYSIQVEEDALAEIVTMTDSVEEDKKVLVNPLPKAPSIWKVMSQKKDIDDFGLQSGTKAYEVFEEVYRIQQLKAYVFLHKLRRGWLIMHLGLSCSLLVVIVTHIISVI